MNRDDIKRIPRGAFVGFKYLSTPVKYLRWEAHQTYGGRNETKVWVEDERGNERSYHARDLAVVYDRTPSAGLAGYNQALRDWQTALGQEAQAKREAFAQRAQECIEALRAFDVRAHYHYGQCIDVDVETLHALLFPPEDEGDGEGEDGEAGEGDGEPEPGEGEGEPEGGTPDDGAEGEDGGDGADEDAEGGRTSEEDPDRIPGYEGKVNENGDIKIHQKGGD